VPPTNGNEVLNISLLYTTHFSGYHFGISSQHAAWLSGKGPYCICDIWNLEAERCKTWDELLYQFHLTPHNRHGVSRMLVAFPRAWLTMLTSQHSLTRPGDWLGLFSTLEVEFP
jgi:hypothetical protein